MRIIHPTLLLPAGFQLAVLLAIVPFVSADLTSLGCLMDDSSDRMLPLAMFKDPAHMTIESCINFCYHRSYLYAGVENGEDCYCGNYLARSVKIGLPTECNVKCPGNSREICGAGHRLNLYWTGTSPLPMIIPDVGEWHFLGCYNDYQNKRALSKQIPVIGGQRATSIASCTAACKRSGFVLAGMEFGRDCYCGNYIDNGGTIPSENCMLACLGNHTEMHKWKGKGKVVWVLVVQIPVVGDHGLRISQEVNIRLDLSVLGAKH
ncbi:WSC domain-containing protein [Lactarius psammicola]|nr:WSC domain-containing protein [Lactarius psammicola]